MLSPKALRAFALIVFSTSVRAEDTIPQRLRSELQAAQAANRVNPMIEAAAAINRATWTATTDSFQAGNEPANVLDSSTSTIWHTAYNPTNVPLPHNVSFLLSSFGVLPPFNTSKHSRILERCNNGGQEILSFCA